MESCPEEIIEKIFIDSSAEELKQLLLVSKSLNSIISNSLKLMSKFTFVLETAQKNANEIIYLDKCTRKYSNVTISKGNAFSIDNDLQIIRNMKKFMRILTFQDCAYSSDDYLSILEMAGPAIGEVKFQNSKIVNFLEGSETKIPKATKPEPKFDKLKLLRLYDTNLEVGQLISSKKLSELDIFMDLLRQTEPGNLTQLLSNFPNLTKLKFDTPNSTAVVAPDDASSYFGPPERTSGKTYELPKLQHLRLSNTRDPQSEIVMNFIKSFSTSLKTLVLSKSSLPIEKFMELLGSLTVLERVVVDIYQEDNDIPRVSNVKLRELDIYFIALNDEFVGQVFSAVPNIQVLKSNVPDETVTRFIQEGKLQKLKSYVKCDRKAETRNMGFNLWDLDDDDDDLYDHLLDDFEDENDDYLFLENDDEDDNDLYLEDYIEDENDVYYEVDDIENDDDDLYVEENGDDDFDAADMYMGQDDEDADEDYLFDVEDPDDDDLNALEEIKIVEDLVLDENAEYGDDLYDAIDNDPDYYDADDYDYDFDDDD